MFGKFHAVYQDWLDFTNTLDQIKMPLNKKSQTELMDWLQGICEAFNTGQFWEEVGSHPTSAACLFGDFGQATI